MNWFENEQIFLRIDELKWELLNKIKNYQIDLRVDWPSILRIFEKNGEQINRIENYWMTLRLHKLIWKLKTWFNNYQIDLRIDW